MIEISRVNTTFECEPFRTRYGFKGGYLSRLWQSVVLLESRNGHQGVGLGTQSVLWSDSSVFAAHSECAGNALMFAVTDYAAQLAEDRSFDTPLDLLDKILPAAQSYAKAITNEPNLRETFVLNALVALDNAAWILYAHEHGIDSFEKMIPQPFLPALSCRHKHVASIPVIGYDASPEQMLSLAQEGYFVIKVKLGHPGDQDEMLRRDIQRIEEVHQVFKNLKTIYTASGKIPYYFDINGRYNGVDRLQQLLDHADRIGALDHVSIVEEPFPDGYETDLSGLGVRIAADESAHTDEDARRLIDMGYGAIALKPVAKTVSMTLRIAAVAARRGVPCFCADLTVNPILVDWNKSFAARLAPLPDLQVGLLETNGHQFYLNWERMKTYHPQAGASWTTARNGIFHLTDDFFGSGSGILDNPEHYLELARAGM